MSALSAILARKARENARRRAHAWRPAASSRARADARFLRRGPGELPRVIAEIKFRSPSEGALRAWRPGEAVRIAKGYREAGAAAISVLCDRAFEGSVLELRRVARAIDRPV